MPAIDEVELNGDLVAGAHREIDLVENLGEGLSRVQDPAGVGSIVQIENCPCVV